ncbi:hypothetical protein [Streptomyces sp. NPDC059788]|uniref:hypothetical protein n=1 Tax=Streptomyces sp. NPDC059788 TaxID=3346948 RepID=UPI00364608E8
MQHPAPFDLNLARLDPDHLADLPTIIEARITTLKPTGTEHEAHTRVIARCLTMAESLTTRRRLVRLQADANWHEQLLRQLSELIKNGKTRRSWHDSMARSTGR